MKIGRKLITIFVVIVLLAITCVPVFAASNQVVYLFENQVWTKGYGEAHDPDYYRCGAMCHSVYPYSGWDLFSNIQCKVTNTYNEVIAVKPTYTLTEGASSYTEIAIMDGELSTTTVFFHFRGNSSAQAQAIVSYTGTITN